MRLTQCEIKVTQLKKSMSSMHTYIPIFRLFSVP